MNVFAFLSFQDELAEADDVQRQLLEEDTPAMPEEYLLVRKLRTFSSSSQPGVFSGIAMLVDGGWYDQPYYTCLVIEAVLSGERRYEAYLNQKQHTGATNGREGSGAVL